jgi:predicted nucleic acid-binding protein
MTLLDTNVVIYASDRATPHYAWACATIADAVSSSGGVVDAVGLAEICVGEADPATAAERIRSWGVEILDIPAAAAEACATAYRRYRERRRQESGKDSPVTPLPDFFIGAHAQVMGWTLATADESRFTTYFPSVRLLTPHTA